MWTVWRLGQGPCYEGEGRSFGADSARVLVLGNEGVGGGGVCG